MVWYNGVYKIVQFGSWRGNARALRQTFGEDDQLDEGSLKLPVNMGHDTLIPRHYACAYYCGEENSIVAVEEGLNEVIEMVVQKGGPPVWLVDLQWARSPCVSTL